MKTFRNLAALTALLFVAGIAGAQVKDYREIKTPSLRAFSMPQPKRIQLANGMVIFIQEDHELPLVRGAAIIRGGGRDIPANKAGMAGIYGSSWRTGGTTDRTGDQLDEFLEARAARVETGASTDSATVSMDVLKGDFDAVFPIWVDVLRKPAFRQEKIDLAKTQANTGISRRNDEPGGIVGRESNKLGYGADSPYARQAEYATIASITRDDLLNFHKQYTHPNNIILSFIGDFDSAQVEKKLRATFESWPRGPQAPKASTAMNPARPGLYFIAKDDVTQANIAMVHPGTTRDNPDYYALAVMNEIFSGGFSGRLMQTLRSQRGLTYGVGGGVGANWDYPGLFRMQMATKSGTTLESVEALKAEAAKLTTQPVTAEELALAKESILNAFVFTRDTRAKALQQQVQLEFYGFPRDYYEKYVANIEKVTAADVERVAKKYVQPNQLAVLVVGKEKDFEKPLSTLGTVTPIDITIPEPGQAPPAGGSGGTAAAPAAPATGNEEGKKLAQLVARYIGGADMKSMQRTMTATMKGPQGEMQMDMTALTRYPDSVKTTMTMPMGTITRVVSPEGAFMITPMGSQDLPSSQRDMALSDLKTDMIVVTRNLDNPKYTFTAGGTEKIGNVETRVLTINADGPVVTWYVDPKTGQILRSVSRETTTDYADWKSWNNQITLPATMVLTRNGEKQGEAKVSEVVFNAAVPEGAFKKP